MITNFKIFENVSILPKIGDYVLIKLDKSADKNLKDFYNNHIGRIENLEGGGYTIIFDDYLTYNSKKFSTSNKSINNFEYWSSNKEELEAIMSARKYNL